MLSASRPHLAADEIVTIERRRPAAAASPRPASSTRRRPARSAASIALDALEADHRPSLVEPHRRRSSIGSDRPGTRACSTRPATNRSSGKSVSGLTITWPRLPCVRATRPTRIKSIHLWPAARSGRYASIAEFDASTFVPSSSAAALASVRTALRGAPLPADHAPHVAGRHRQLDERLAARVALGDADRVRLVRPAPSRSPRRRPVRGSRRGGFRRRAGVGRRRLGGMRSTSVRTVSDGCAPSFSQCASRSRSSFSVSGFVRGL